MNLIHKPDLKYSNTHLEYRTAENDLSIDIKWDGCVNIRTTANGYTVDESHHENSCAGDIHICNLPEFISQLQQVLDAALAKGFEV